MDNHERKRVAAIGRVLADTVFLIKAMLEGLDDIQLTLHPPGPGVRERIADDYMLVAREILPGIGAPAELLAMARSVLVDWVTLSDLVDSASARDYAPRRLDTMEEVAERLAATLVIIRDLYPEVFEDRE